MLRFIALIAAPALLAAPALAQTTYVEIDDDAFIVTQYNLTVDQIEDMDLYGPGGDQIGEIEEVLIDASGDVVGLSVETENFLGIGGEDVILGLDQVELVGDRFVTSLTEDQLEASPRWED
jgi:sporulation protein YlmC with PRC-barrel domain